MTQTDEIRAQAVAARETVRVGGYALLAARLEDGRIVVELPPVCEALDLNERAQVRRIRQSVALASEFVTIADDGDERVAALTLRALPLWLASLSVPHIAEELRPLLRTLQLEAAETIGERFAWRNTIPLLATLPTPPRLNHAEPSEVSVQDAPEAPPPPDDPMRVVESILEPLATVMPAPITPRPHGPVIAPAHQRELRLHVKRLADVTGLPFAVIYTQFNEAFGVLRYGDLLDAAWPEITAWFRARIAAGQ